MKRQLMLLIGLLAATISFSQDKISLHNGETIDGKVSRVSKYVINYTFANETAEQTISKYAVEKITHSSSSRVEKVTNKIDISGEDGWNNAVLLEDKSQITGLTKVDNIKGKSAFINMRSANGTDTKATMGLKNWLSICIHYGRQGLQIWLRTGIKSDNKRAIPLKY